MCADSLSWGKGRMDVGRANGGSRGGAMIMVMIVVLLIIQKAMGLHFKYPSFDLKKTSGITLMDDASINSSLSSLSLTKVANLSTGRVFYTNPVPLWTTTSHASFSTSFRIRIANTTPEHFGDGIAFLLSATLSQPPPNSYGSGLGLLNHSLNGHASNRVIAIEFDTFRNLPYSDIDNNHVGIDVNSINSTASRSLYERGIELKFGTEVMAWVEYDGVDKLLSVEVATEPFIKPTTGEAPPFIAIRIDLSKFLPNDIYVGFSAATGGYTEYHHVLSWEFNITSPFPVPSSRILSSRAIVGITLAAGFLLIVLALLFRQITIPKRNAKRREWNLGNAELAQCAGARRFTYKEIMRATKNFSEENYLGRGGFGPVYKGILPKVGTPVAVKSVGENSKQGEREFLAEVTIISRVRHRNLVQLHGWCHDKGKLFLVYEFMPNSSLDHHLFKGRTNQNLRLGWKERHKIVCGLAAGLLYLHEEWEKQVLHRDVKSANVMLDRDFNARLSDFGMARLVNHDETLETTRAVGTFGYIAPEVVWGGKVTTASDVYGFGAVALEVACGRPTLDNKAPPSEVQLVEWVWELYSKGKLLQAVDRVLGDEYVEEEMEKLLCLGLACSHPHPHSRPTMRQVHDCLRSVSPTPPIPTSKPMFFCSNNAFQSPPSTTSQVPNDTTTFIYHDSHLGSNF